MLADDMGLGKTVQTLAHLLVEKREGRLDRPCLVVCPTSVLPNWLRGGGAVCPGLRVLSLHGADRGERFDEIGEADLVLTTYALLPRDADRLLPVEWHIVVLDEAQAIKNAAAKTTQLVCRLTARHRLCLTGTPVENHLGELWSLFAFLMPGLLGDAKRFARVFRTPIEKKRRRRAPRRPGAARQAVPVAPDQGPGGRRTAAQDRDAAPDRAFRGRNATSTRRCGWRCTRRCAGEVAAKGFARSRIIVLDALLKLRQVCCDPRLVKLAAARQVRASAKLDHLMEMLPPLIEEGGACCCSRNSPACSI